MISSRDNNAAMFTDEVFVRKVRSFLDGRVLRRSAAVLEWGLGSDVIPVFDSPSKEEESEQLHAARCWLRDRFDAGFSWIDGPLELGGAGLATRYAEIYAVIEAEYETPKLDVLIPSLRIVIPGLIACASIELKKNLLPKLLRGDLVCCQLFSEPGAGSDLATIRTSALMTGQTWIISGQKVWTTGAHFSDIGLLIARTAKSEPPHRGLTAFVVDMRDSAIKVKPLRHMGGEAHFNEVFIDDLRVLDSYRVGDVGQGWAVAMATLMGERQALGNSQDAPPLEVAERLEMLFKNCASLSTNTTSVLIDAVMKVRILAEVLQLTNERLALEAKRSGNQGPEGSIAKILKNKMLRLATDTAGLALGPQMIAETEVWGTTSWGRATVLAPGLLIGGGTDEIQRNILAERVLGLPKEPRPATNK